MEIHNYLGSGFLEVVYKDALELEFTMAGIPFEREKEYFINYKGYKLPHRFFADFIVYDKIILEVKDASTINETYVAQTLNYLKVSGERLALITNFGENSLNYQRIIL